MLSSVGYLSELEVSSVFCLLLLSSQDHKLMMSKRPFDDDNGEDRKDGPSEEAKRFKNDVTGGISLEKFVSMMEPFIREVISDEVERAVLRFLQPSSRPSFHRGETSGARGLVLQFVNRLPDTIFTANRIEAEDGSAIRVELIDANTNSIVASGALASMKLEILVLNADFGPDDQEDWDETEFTANIVREREGRRPLLNGELNLTLKDGVGQIGDVVFTDNSSWQRRRRFRLGVRCVQKIPPGMRIREARSEPFMVKDHRGELYRKHHPPHLDDEVWRLEKIAKEGPSHKRLSDCGIFNVKGFLQMHMINPSRLRQILGSSISNKLWDIIIDHASSCIVNDGKFYAYHEAGKNVGLLFNSVYKAIGATFDGQNYELLEKLTPPHKALIENVKGQAYQNVDSFMAVDANAIFGFGPSRALISMQPEQFHGPSLGPQQIEFPVTRQDQPEMQLDFNNPSSATQFSYNPETISHLGVFSGQTSHPMQVLPEMLRNSFKVGDINLSFPHSGESGNWASSSSQWPLLTRTQPHTDDNSQVQTPTSCALMNSPWGQGSFLLTPGDGGELGMIASRPGFNVHTTSKAKPRVGWCKLRAALLWGSVKREVANKRLWQEDLSVYKFLDM